jgi:hypothetical protein
MNQPAYSVTINSTLSAIVAQPFPLLPVGNQIEYWRLMTG